LDQKDSAVVGGLDAAASMIVQRGEIIGIAVRAKGLDNSCRIAADLDGRLLIGGGRILCCSGFGK